MWGFARMRKHFRGQTREGGFLNEKRNFSETEGVYMSSTMRADKSPSACVALYGRINFQNSKHEGHEDREGHEISFRKISS